MNASPFGLSTGTIVCILGVPLLIMLALLAWGIAYHPVEAADSSDQPSER